MKKNNQRSKISKIQSLNFPKKLDYVILGSSRALNHINPKMIYDSTKITGYNLGYAACGPFEIKLLFNEIIKNCNVDNFYIQVDYSFNHKEPNNLAVIGWLPYIKNREIYNEFAKHGFKYKLYRYIPFYRYMKNDPKIGFREIVLILFDKKNIFDINYGFYNNNSNTLKTLSEEKTSDLFLNETINTLIKKGKLNNKKIYFFTAPITKSHEIKNLENFLPNYTNFSDSIIENKYFSDERHLNILGAEKFTNIFINHYINEISEDKLFHEKKSKP